MLHKSRLVCLLILSLLLTSVAYKGAFAQDGETPKSSKSAVYQFSDGAEVEDAWSTMTRYENGVIATLHTTNLPANDVVTMWWVVFNEPQNCSDACGEDDIFMVDEEGELVIGQSGPQLNLDQIEAAQIALLGATGTVVDEAGNAHFSAVLSKGDNPNLVFGPALLNPLTAEVHLVLRTHGQMSAEALDEQIIMFNGGCASEWPNEPCLDLQFAVHQAE